MSLEIVQKKCVFPDKFQYREFLEFYRGCPADLKNKHGSFAIAIWWCNQKDGLGWGVRTIAKRTKTSIYKVRRILYAFREPEPADLPTNIE
ncbi:MAG: hypothetical protein WCY09_08065 [Candidatus Omnitrophota bacterium]